MYIIYVLHFTIVSRETGITVCILQEVADSVPYTTGSCKIMFTTLFTE